MTIDPMKIPCAYCGVAGEITAPERMSMDMVFRYAHLGESHLAEWAKNSTYGTNTAQSVKNPMVATGGRA